MSQTAPRGWTISADEYESWDDFRDAVRQSMVDAEAIGHRLGGACVCRPVRQEGADGLYRTVAWVFNWQSFVPAQRAQQSAPEPEPEPVGGELAGVGALAEVFPGDEDPDGAGSES